MGVKEIEEGRYGRVDIVSPDPLKITCKRGTKKHRKEGVGDKDKPRKLYKNKSKVKLVKCVSMWKNPTSQIIPLEMRVAHDRFRSIQPEINLGRFGELKSSLDSAEGLYSQETKKKAIKKERIEETKRTDKSQLQE
ncbi:hypothetical protein EROM_030160 [Encephalitozoon romaleae SJ-2008]|uniref:SKI-interacting protein SKIP SNW domain-containing protein n=1 Tax=Encephalitozoon romaleae (strain SJ-2008) TaxID=1178016 RepID=I7ADJ9_ENCRO|nr:hypothetical protein EROM_030160 [Encephalitozoon romaleae SJ-2008]AFN82635.1 hypothetical protein EROM_030160 [Encephalitozoon romaleae SJ-2008]